MNFERIKAFETKYNWIISSNIVHGILGGLATGSFLGAIIAFCIDFDHLKLNKSLIEQIKDRTYGYKKPHMKGDFLHKRLVLILSVVIFVFSRLFFPQELILIASLAILVHLIQDYLEDWLFFEDVSGWSYR